MSLTKLLQWNTGIDHASRCIDLIFLSHQQHGAHLRSWLPGLVNVPDKQSVRDLIHDGLSISSLLKGSSHSYFRPVAAYSDESLYWPVLSMRSSAHAPPHLPGSRIEAQHGHV